MVRAIDRRPLPAKVKPVKVVVVSMSRSGTMALYNALQVLGFDTYHVNEGLINGAEDMAIMAESVAAEHFGMGRRFGRDEFDKWFSNYDAIVEIPCFCPESFMARYGGEPDVKFILTERDPDKWVASWRSTIGMIVVAFGEMPMVVLRHFDPLLRSAGWFADMLAAMWTANKGVTAEGLANSRQYYVDYIARIKTMVPHDRLLHLRLEDGLDWDKICPFLGVETPTEPWPARHNVKEFQDGVGAHLAPSVWKACAKVGMLVAGTLAAAGGACWWVLLR